MESHDTENLTSATPSTVILYRQPPASESKNSYEGEVDFEMHEASDVEEEEEEEENEWRGIMHGIKMFFSL